MLRLSWLVILVVTGWLVFNSGLANTHVRFERAVEGTDANGAPTRTWVPIRTCWGKVENEQISATETIQAPLGQNIRTFTLELRNSPSVELTTRDRAVAVNGSWLGAITGIRYTAMRDVVFVDIETGASAG